MECAERVGQTLSNCSQSQQGTPEQILPKAEPSAPAFPRQGSRGSQLQPSARHKEAEPFVQSMGMSR